MAAEQPTRTSPRRLARRTAATTAAILTTTLLTAITAPATPVAAADSAAAASPAGADGGSLQVRVLQRRLTHSGDRPGPVDGRYGPLTQAAVSRFQAAHGLLVDGIADPATLKALNARPQIVYPGAGVGRRTGSTAVKALQRSLRAHRFSPGAIDGRFGPATLAAVERFQRAHHLQVDGIIGARTWAALDARTARPRGPASPPKLPAPIRGSHRPAPAPVSSPATTSPPHQESPVHRAARRGNPDGPLQLADVILIVVAVLGLLTASLSYTRTRGQVRRAITDQRLRSPRIADGPPAQCRNCKRPAEGTEVKR